MPRCGTMFHKRIWLTGLISVCSYAHPTVVVRWNQALLQGVRDSRLGPPMVARALAIVHTCMYDAWAAYDDHAFGAVLGDTLRRPANERRPENVATAISFAAYRCAVNLFPADKSSVFDPLMTQLGLEASNTWMTPSTAAGMGNT